MTNALGPWGISPGAEELYRLLLRLPDALDREDGEGAFYSADADSFLGELERAGLVIRRSDRMIVMPPSKAIESLVTREMRGLDARLQELGEAKSTLTRYAADYRPQAADTPLAQIVPFPESRDVVLGLIHEADAPVNTMYLTLEPAWSERRELLEQAFALSKGFRLLIPIEYLNHEQILSDLRALSAASKIEMRLVTRVVTSFSVFGNTAASTLTDPHDYHSDRLIMRTPALISIFNDYFDTVWRVGIPLTQEADRESDRVLLLLAQGLKDEAIASQLRLSLRTVRRRIAELMDQLGVDSRFQAGVEAARRGLI